MRIALVTQRIPGDGGVGTIVGWLQQGLTAAGDVVDVFALATRANDPLSSRMTAPRTWAHGPRSSEDPTGLIRWGATAVEAEPMRYRPRAGLTATLDSYDLVQVVSGSPALGWAVTDCRRPKVLQVATTFDHERRAQLAGMSVPKAALQRGLLPVLSRIERYAVKRMDHVLVENRPMLAWVRGAGQRAVTLSPPGVDTVHFQRAGRWRPDLPVLAFGRLWDARKDWATAVTAYELLVARSGFSPGMTIAGRGPLPAALRNRIAQSPARDGIRVLEDVPLAELPMLFSRSSVFLQSSLEEGLGLAGLEAMACGLPVVATATVGAKEYVQPGVNGFLAPLGAGAAVELAAGLDRVLSSGDDKLSTAAVETCRRGYSNETALQRFRQVYRDVSAGSPRSRPPRTRRAGVAD